MQKREELLLTIHGIEVTSEEQIIGLTSTKLHTYMHISNTKKKNMYILLLQFGYNHVCLTRYNIFFFCDPDSMIGTKVHVIITEVT